MDLGCGLFGMAFELDEDFWGSFEKLAKAGFTAVEPLYAFENDPALAPDSPVPGFLKTIMWDSKKVEAYQPKLKDLGLTISSMHVGFLFGKSIEEGCADMLAFSQKSGVKHFMTSMEFDSKEKADAAIELMNRAADTLKETGVSLGYHNHYQEFQRMEDGRTYMDYFLEKTDPSVKLQLDVGWQLFGGDDPVEFIRKYADRIVSIHLKDFVSDFKNTAEDDAFAAIGDGALDTRGILELMPTLHLMENGWMIDQDKAAKDAVLSEDLAKGAEYIRRCMK